MKIPLSPLVWSVVYTFVFLEGGIGGVMVRSSKGLSGHLNGETVYLGLFRSSQSYGYGVPVIL